MQKKESQTSAGPGMIFWVCVCWGAFAHFCLDAKFSEMVFVGGPL